MAGRVELSQDSQGPLLSSNDAGEPPVVIDTHKRKTPPAATGSRFKAVGTMVLAMRRFQASLNPTVTFGKQTSSAGGSASSSGGLQGAEATSSPRGPLDSANKGKLQRTKTPSSRNRLATILQPLPKEVDV